MAKSASMYIRIDPQVKAEVEVIYARYGMSVTDAINVFLYQSKNIGGLPFDLRPQTHNTATLSAMQEVEDMRNGKLPKKVYASFSELLEEVQNEV